MIKLKCVVCGKEILRYKSHIKSNNVFCSPMCKAKGMSIGLVADMRKGTGCDFITKYYKRKYYKYRVFDKKRGFKTIDIGIKRFVELLRNGECAYCGSRKNLGLDRIDNNNGHFLGNTVIACQTCNMTRGDRFTVSQMKKIGKIIKTFYE